MCCIYSLVFRALVAGAILYIPHTCVSATLLCSHMCTPHVCVCVCGTISIVLKLTSISERTTRPRAGVCVPRTAPLPALPDALGAWRICRTHNQSKALRT